MDPPTILLTCCDGRPRVTVAVRCLPLAGGPDVAQLCVGRVRVSPWFGPVTDALAGADLRDRTGPDRPAGRQGRLQRWDARSDLTCGLTQDGVGCWCRFGLSVNPRSVALPRGRRTNEVDRRRRGNIPFSRGGPEGSDGRGHPCIQQGGTYKA